jgi:hypothetical protein
MVLNSRNNIIQYLLGGFCVLGGTDMRAVLVIDAAWTLTKPGGITLAAETPASSY